MGRLPPTQTAGFEAKWAQLQRFNRALDAASTGVWATAAFVLTNILVFAALAVSEKRIGNFDLPQLLDWGANYGPLTVNGQWWRLETATFLHFDLMHVLVNMWALWNVGRLTERLYGRWIFVGLYFGAGLLASLTSVLWDPNQASIGASGAIFGIFGALLAYLTRQRKQVPRALFHSHWFSTAIFVLFSLISGALQTGVDNAAHVGGLISGFAMGWVLARPLHAAGRAPLQPRHALAITIFAILGIAGVIQVRGTGSQMTELEGYWQQHEWYVRGEAENLRAWQALAARAGSGSISNLELGYQFENNILPFWDQAADRPKKQDAAFTGDQARFATMLSDYVENRRAWAAAIISKNKDRDGKTLEDIQELASKSDKITARMARIKLRDSMAHRPRALSSSPPIAYLRYHLFGGGGSCVRPPAYFHWRQVAPTDLKSDGPATADAFACGAEKAFNAGDFATLEGMLNNSSKNLNDLADGTSSLAAIASGLGDLFEFSARDPMADFGRIADWRRSYPESVMPDLVEAMLFHSWAWAARGSGTSDTISAQMMALYNYRTEMAAAALEDMKPRAAANPLWYRLSIDVGLDQSLGVKKLRETFDEGRAKFPDDWALYRRMIRVLLPRWEGSATQETVFIDDMSSGDTDQAAQNYARLVWIYSDFEEDRDNVFDENNVSWPTVKTGFRALLKRYPKSDSILNGFAKMACRVDAVTEYTELRPQLNTRLSSTVWSDSVSLESCDKNFEEALKSAHAKL